jgi:hypothetical protein
VEGGDREAVLAELENHGDRTYFEEVTRELARDTNIQVAG